MMDEEDLDIMIKEDEAAKEEAEATAAAEHVKRLSKAKEPKTTHMCVVYIHNNVRTYICTYVRTYVRTYARIYVRTYVRTYI